MSTEPPWGGYPDRSESTSPPGYQPVPGYPPPPTQPSYAPPQDYGQPVYPSQPFYPAPPTYPSQPLNEAYMFGAQPTYPGVLSGEADQNGGLAIAALILGIVGIPLAIFTLCDAPFIVLAITFGAAGLRSRRRHTLALAGLILGIISAAFVVLVMIVNIVNHISPVP